MTIKTTNYLILFFLILTTQLTAQTDLRQLIGSTSEKSGMSCTIAKHLFVGSFKKMKDQTVTKIHLRPFKDNKYINLRKVDFNNIKRELESYYKTELISNSSGNVNSTYSTQFDAVTVNLILNGYNPSKGFSKCNIELNVYSKELEQKRIDELKHLSMMSNKEKKKYLKELKSQSIERKK